jgi:acetate kinase
VTRRVLCVNLGSRTAKLTVLDVRDQDVPGEPAAPSAGIETPLHDVGAEQHLAALDSGSIDLVAYRVVRTTDRSGALAAPFDAAARAGIIEAAEFAPLHTGPVVAAFDALSARLPRAGHVAVFDAAFHHTIPAAAGAYGLPYDDFTAGWRKVGFHGLSHAYAAARAAVLLGDREPVRKLVSAHLGGGASVAAIDGARSTDTTMGFTPLDGLIMATRSGALDPGMLLAYMRRKQLSVDAAEDLLTQRSGLLGLAGTADMRAVIAGRESGEPRAVLAYEAFVYRVSAAIGAMIASLRGLDAIAFLGGIGENAAGVRAGACAPFAFLGAVIDPARNANPRDDAVISADGARVSVLCVRAREDWMMALAACRIA